MPDKSRPSRRSQVEFDNHSKYRDKQDLWDTVGREEMLELFEDPYGDGEEPPRVYGTCAEDYSHWTYADYHTDPYRRPRRV